MSIELEKLASTIDKRAQRKAEAGKEERSLSELTRKRRMSQREQNRLLWQEYFERQARSHATLAASYARRAVEITNERS